MRMPGGLGRCYRRGHGEAGSGCTEQIPNSDGALLLVTAGLPRGLGHRSPPPSLDWGSLKVQGPQGIMDGRGRASRSRSPDPD